MADFVDFTGTGLRYLGYALSPLALLPLLILIVPTQMERPGRFVSGVVDRISGVAMALAVTAAFAIILIQLGAVLMRYVFGLSFSWLNDSVIFSFAMMFMLGAAATLRDDRHVRVDILRPNFSPHVRAMIELLGALVFIIPIGVLILYAGSGMIARSWAGLETFNESDGLPIKYLFKTMVPLFAILLIGQAISQAIKAAMSLRGLQGFEESGHEHEGAM
ncbi:TRAP transporter small permease subunit [Hyphomonas sp. FCG-A18]|uniref:TRAP transporter small permease subunit n=1 Tax=Hyphomonas sp. FCG-A18 TaxID=3080019 RepID=UPI002B3048C0|nr:TRAP transporter small permease subunit [Hyphomonas sp. FCG-A18]